MPPDNFEIVLAIRIGRVSAFLPEVTQQIHSLRASGVISSHKAKAFAEERTALRRSAGRGCTLPLEIF
jgi:hypothetical protein